MQRHLHTLPLASADHGRHDARREANDLGLLNRQRELEVLNQLDKKGKTLDDADKSRHAVSESSSEEICRW